MKGQQGRALGQQGAPPCYSSLWETLGHLHLPSIRSIVFAPFKPSNLPIRINSSIAIILMGKRELVALLNLSSLCLVMVEQLFLAVPRGCLWFVNVVFPDHTHLLLKYLSLYCKILYLHDSYISKNSEYDQEIPQP